MNQNLTEIIAVIDRSGSMSSCKEEAQNSFNHFVEEQRKGVGEVRITIAQFDSEYDLICNGEDIHKVGNYHLVPRGMTALNDAVGKTIATVGDRLANTPEKDRPALIIFIIVTDGGENASREYSKSRVKEMIEHQTNKYNWQFNFLGSNQDSFKEAANIGINLDGVANYASHANAYAGMSMKAHRMRRCSFGGEYVSNSFTEEEMKTINGEQSADV